ncbi:TIGR03089 family protein [Pilimelia terevasa]|uniref:TIGR03089 family protein n=1 Tax=Pilimelia terevasa TaxID=53372 RepID=UPI001E508B98|nr:TIGR03089 family protein [Pilimelia terevasa]
MKSPETADGLFAAAIAADATLPVLTWYDDATGERVELSGATLDNWRAKAANLLVDECGLGPGDRAQVLLPPHWQTAVVLLGCWSAGLAVTVDGPADVVFGTVDAAGELDPGAADRYVLGLAPLGMPMRQAPPPGCTDFVAAVRGQGDRFAPAAATAPTDPAWPGLDHAALCAAARARAAALGLTAGSRVLVETARHRDPRDWLLAPLAVGARTVLCTAPPPAGRAEAEKITHHLR